MDMYKPWRNVLWWWVYMFMKKAFVLFIIVLMCVTETSYWYQADVKSVLNICLLSWFWIMKIESYHQTMLQCRQYISYTYIYRANLMDIGCLTLSNSPCTWYQFSVNRSQTPSTSRNQIRCNIIDIWNIIGTLNLVIGGIRSTCSE
jgi:hypothetical protein